MQRHPFPRSARVPRLRPWLAASLAIHAMLLTALYYTGYVLPEVDAQQRQVAASGRPDSHSAMRRRVSDMERVKELMRESLGEAGGSEAGAPHFDATTAPPAPADMLARAEALTRDISALAARAHLDSVPAPAAHGAASAAPLQGQAQGKEPDPAGGTAPPPPAPPAAAPSAQAAAERDRPAEAGADAQDKPALAAAPPPADNGKLPASAGALAAGAASGSNSASASESASSSTAGAVPPAASASDAGAAGMAAAPSMGGGTGGAGNGIGGIGAGAGDAAAAAARIAALEQYARSVLAQRQEQLEKSGLGKPANGRTPGADAVPPGVAGRIAAFVNRDKLLSTGWNNGNYRTNGLELFHHGAGRMAQVDTGAMRKAGGRLLGSGGQSANRVYVNSWYLIGPFAGKHGTGMFANASYPPEQSVELDAAYRGKDERFLTWRYVQSPTYPLVPPDAQEDSVYYGYTELMMEAERELAVWIGADDDAQVWINDQLVWKGGNVNKRWFFQEIYDTGVDYATAYNLNEGKVQVRFRKGRNKLFFKLSNGPSRAFFSMVLAPA